MNIIISSFVLLAISATQIEAVEDSEIEMMRDRVTSITKNLNDFYPRAKIMLDNVKIELMTDKVDKIVDNTKKSIVEIVFAAKTTKKMDTSECMKYGEKECMEASFQAQKAIQKCYVAQLSALQKVFSETSENEKNVVKMLDDAKNDLELLPKIQSQIVEYSDAVNKVKMSEVASKQVEIINCSKEHITMLEQSLAKVVGQVTGCLKM